MHERMCRSPGGLGGEGQGGRRRGVDGLGRYAAPVSRRAGGSSPRVEPPQVEEELREDLPTLRGGEEGLQGSAQGKAVKTATPSSLFSACIYVQPAWLLGRRTCLRVSQLRTHPALSSP